MNTSKHFPDASERPMLSSLLILLGFVMIGMVVGSFLQLMVMYIVSGGGDIMEMINHPDKMPNSWLALILSQGLASLVMFVGVALLYWIGLEHKEWNDFNWKHTPTIIIFLLAFLIQFCSLPLNSWFANLNNNIKLPASLASLEQAMKDMEAQMAKATELMTNFTEFWQLLLAILVIGVIAGIGEELIFRGLVQRKIWLGTGNIHVAIWVAAAIFSFIHFQFYGFLPRLLLGALLGYLYYWSGNIWLPIAAHIFNNTLAVILLYLSNIKVISPELEKMETVPFSAVLVSAIMTAGLLGYFRKIAKTI